MGYFLRPKKTQLIDHKWGRRDHKEHLRRLHWAPSIQHLPSSVRFFIDFHRFSSIFIDFHWFFINFFTFSPPLVEFSNYWATLGNFSCRADHISTIRQFFQQNCSRHKTTIGVFYGDNISINWPLLRCIFPLKRHKSTKTNRCNSTTILPVLSGTMPITPGMVYARNME